jgi:hypothetical protein
MSVLAAGREQGGEESHMTTKRLVLLGLTLALGARPMVGVAQTQTHLLQKGIFTEDTLGDLDAAIQIYRQVLATHSVPRSIEEQAQLRLAESLRKKGQAPQASPSASAQQPQENKPDPNRCCGFFSDNYDANRPVSLTGTVTAVQWMNPETVVYVEAVDGNKWAFTIAAPNAMVRAGMTKDLFKLGEQVRVNAFLATGAATSCPAQLPTACSTLPNGALLASAKTITALDGRNLFDRQAMQRAAAAAPQP